MALMYDLTLYLYNVTLLPVIFFTILLIVMCALNLFMDKEKVPRYKKFKTLPFVSVQIPTFNDAIAKRCVEQCMKFDYPKDRYEIIIVDDSTDKDIQKSLSAYAKKHSGFIKYIHRKNREGYKPGALRNAMKITKGEILVVFDSDWIPAKNFLKKVTAPFSDPDVAIVQTRQGFYNKDKSLLTRFAAYSLMIYHTIVLPINDKINCVFFCGTAGAIRRSHFDEVGGWNVTSITEDSELSVRLFMKGYKSIYLKEETPSEVPETFEGFIKQQMRWCYGNVRVFLDNAKKIMANGNLGLRQKTMILYLTLGNFIAPIVVFMTFFGMTGWFLGDPQLLNWQDVYTLVSRFLFTAGFLFIGFVTLLKRNITSEFPVLIMSAFTIGLILAVANTIAAFRALFNRGLNFSAKEGKNWVCTPKAANDMVE